MTLEDTLLRCERRSPIMLLFLLVSLLPFGLSVDNELLPPRQAALKLVVKAEDIIRPKVLSTTKAPPTTTAPPATTSQSPPPIYHTWTVKEKATAAAAKVAPSRNHRPPVRRYGWQPPFTTTFIPLTRATETTAKPRMRVSSKRDC